MSEPISVGNSFWTGVLSTVAAGVILAVLSWGATSMSGNKTASPLMATDIQIPIDLGLNLDVNFLNRDYLIEAIRQAEPPTSPRPSYSESQRTQRYAANKEAISTLVQFAADKPSALKIIKITNTSTKVVNSIRVTAKDAIWVSSADKENRISLNRSDTVVISRIEPQETKEIFIWGNNIYAFSLKNSIKILASDEVVPVKRISSEPNDLVSELVDYFGILIVIPTILLCIGALGTVIMPIAAYIQQSDALRRKNIGKVEFDRMLGDVAATYERFRSDRPNPLQDELTP